MAARDRRAPAAEALGTGFLLAAVVGSGIMAERLAGANVALALLANRISTGAILAVIITPFGPIPRAHFDPALTHVFALRGDLARGTPTTSVAVQVAGGVLGVLTAHVMFDVGLLQPAATERTGAP